MEGNTMKRTVHNSKYFCGNEISNYGQAQGYLDYSTFAKAFDAVLVNDITKLFYGSVNGEYIEPEQINGYIDNSEQIEELREQIEELNDDENAEQIEELEEQIEELEREQDEQPEIYQYYIVLRVVEANEFILESVEHSIALDLSSLFVVLNEVMSLI
jgi:DNA-binding transcriptional MerR regulator